MQPRFLSIAAGLAAALGLLLEAGGAWPHDRAPAAWHWLFLAAAAAALLQLGLRRDGSAAARLRRLAWLVPVGLGLLLPSLLRTTPTEAWLARGDARLQRRFEVLRARVLGLEASARALGDSALTLVDSIPVAAGPEARVRLFDALEAMQRVRPAAAPAAPSVRLFDARGQLLAWAGTTHSGASGVRLTFFAPGPREIYFRRSGAGIFLVYDRQDGRDDATPADSVHTPRVLVEIPMSSFGRPGGEPVASRAGDDDAVEWNYEARLVPPYLTQKDIEIHGDPERGLQGDFVIRGADGVPRLLGRLSAPPRDDETLLQASRERRMQAWLVLVALGLGAWAVWSETARRAPWGSLWDRPWPLLAGLWMARLLLGFLHLPSPSLQGPGVLQPAAFAMDGFFGVLRTPLDLLLTALVLLASAALLFVQRLRRQTRHPEAAPAGTLRTLLGLLAAAASTVLAVRLAVAAAVRVAQNTSLPLLGTALDLQSPPALCLHAALLAGLAALLLLALLLVARLTPPRPPRWLLALAAAGVALALGLQSLPLAALVGIVVLWGGAGLHALFLDERFTSFSLATLVLVALAATLTSEALQGEDFHAREEHVLARADEVRRLVDEERPFVLKHVLQDLEAEANLLEELTPGDATASASAYEIWSGSLLRGLSWPCQVRVYDELGQLASEFSIGLPYPPELPTLDSRERASITGAHIEQTEIEARSVGVVRLYRGSLPVHAGRLGQLRGYVVIDLPFAHESLVLAANPRLSPPELLQAGSGRGVGPRVGEAQLYLLAWLQGGFVSESSTPYLEVGEPLRDAGPAHAGWKRLRLANGAYLATEIPAGERTLLAGFHLLSPLERLLQWTQIAALDFAGAVAVLLVLMGLGRSRAAARALPALLVPKRLGFQQKLMGAFLVVALLPSVVVSLATQRIMAERSKSRNRDVAVDKARAAEAALTNVVRRELQSVLTSEYVEWYLRNATWYMTPGPPPARDIPSFSTVTVFSGRGSPILDETLSDFSDAEGLAFITAAPRRVFASRDGVNHLALGALEPVWFTPEARPGAAPQLFYLYYRRRLDDGMLRELVPILSTDISAFLGPRLVVSSQKSLAAAGVLPLLLSPAAYKSVLLRNNRYAVVEESAGEQRYFSSYVPLEDRFGERLGALAAQQLLQPDEFAVEVDRTRALVVGLSTSMFVLTLALAVAFAARIFDPLRSLIEGTRRIAGGNLAFRLQARGRDEIGELERSFNDMAARLQTARLVLEERQRYLEAVLGNIASGVVATDVQGRITAANAAAERLLRLPPEGLEGRTWGELAAAAKDSGVRDFWAQVGTGAEGAIHELSMRRSEGRLTLRLIVTDLRPSGVDESLGRVAIFEDLTEMIRSKKLAAWAEMARQVAHEIKNPLTPLKLSAQFMEQAFRDKSDKFPEIFSEGMQTIVQQVDVLRRIASEFSGFGRVSKREPQPLDLGAVLRRVTAPYRSVQGLQLDLGADGSDSFPGDGLVVRGDEEGLRRVFTNVLENAREAMGGTGRIALSVEAAEAGQVRVRVTDEGSGLTAEARERLFEPYFSTKSTGTGLGLAITRSILEELGGSISLSNRPGGGAEVQITLPT